MSSLPPIADLLLASAALCLTGAAVAVALARARPEHPQVAGDFMAVLDGDGDGVLSPQEHARLSDGELPFALADVDGSGALEAWELELSLAYHSPLAPQQNLLPRVR